VPDRNNENRANCEQDGCNGQRNKNKAKERQKDKKKTSEQEGHWTHWSRILLEKPTVA
jgi:hypothetical protein